MGVESRAVRGVANPGAPGAESLGPDGLTRGPGEHRPVLSKETGMKRQETKKLTLTRETLRTLEAIELGGVAGGEVGRVSSDNRACTYSRACDSLANG